MNADIDMQAAAPNDAAATMTVDVEDWYHVLDTPVAPSMASWSEMESRIEPNVDRLLELFATWNLKGTFFWLGWIAERNPGLLHRCHGQGHEVASHGYAHILPYRAGPKAFGQDIDRAKKKLEDMIGEEVKGFRAPGFGIREASSWAFDVIGTTGYKYDASVFPASRSHGGVPSAPMDPYVIATSRGPLLEVPMTAVDVLGRRLCLFSGGYLRLSPLSAIRWGAKRVRRSRRHLVVLVHPRELDVQQPRLPLGFLRRFKYYVNLRTALPKLTWLCKNHFFVRMCDFASALEHDKPGPDNTLARPVPSMAAPRHG